MSTFEIFSLKPKKTRFLKATSTALLFLTEPRPINTRLTAVSLQLRINYFMWNVITQLTWIHSAFCIIRSRCLSVNSSCHIQNY